MKSFALLFVVALAAVASAQSIDECLQQDSISCVQKSLFRKAKEFFEKDSFELVSGVSLVKAKSDRSSRSGKDLVYEQEIDQAPSVAERQSALENFVGEEVSDFFSGRSLRVSSSSHLCARYIVLLPLIFGKKRNRVTVLNRVVNFFSLSSLFLSLRIFCNISEKRMEILI